MKVYILIALLIFLYSCTTRNECISQYSHASQQYFSGREWINIDEFEDLQALFQYNSDLKGKSRPVLYVEIGEDKIPLDSRLIGVSEAITDYFGYSVSVNDYKETNFQTAAEEIDHGNSLMMKKAVENVYFHLRLNGPIDKSSIASKVVPLLNTLCSKYTVERDTMNWFWPIVLFDASRPIPPPPPPTIFNED